tara:strand:+ start:298 stop:531 length:234 start_codon:yes stop_codon:yes gene_type:complete
MRFLYVLALFLGITFFLITINQTREEFISMGNYNIYKKYNKTKNRYRRKLNKIIRRNNKKMIPVLKKQIDRLSLISL